MGAFPTTSSTDTGDDDIGPAKGESDKERVDRELREMLEEIRVALPGLQLLLGFLLILPFSDGFAELGTAQHDVYLTCFVSTAAASALLVAPTAAHRLGFRKVDKLALLLRTNRQIVAALVLIAVSLSLAAYLVASVVLDSGPAAVIAAGVALWFALWWFVLPELTRRRTPKDQRVTSAPSRSR